MAEGDENFELTITAVSLPNDVAHGNPNTTTVTILDDDG